MAAIVRFSILASSRLQRSVLFADTSSWKWYAKVMYTVVAQQFYHTTNPPCCIILVTVVKLGVILK